jgi:hypothetical protein
MDRLIKRGRSDDQPASQQMPTTGVRGPSVLLVGLSEQTRQGLAAGQPTHLRVPVGTGIIDLVIVGTDTEVLPPDIAAVLESAVLVVQVSDEED